MYKIKCNDCGYSRKVELFLEAADKKCLNCTSEDVEVTQIETPEPLGDNYPHINPLYNDLQNRLNNKAPKINQNDINDLIIDLNITKARQL
jgi:hypothetical protein